MSKVELYVGAPILWETERVAIEKIRNVLIQSFGQNAVILANLTAQQRQIDIVVAVEKKVLLIEVKGHKCPLRGKKNGNWEWRSASGKWYSCRNYYRQVEDAKHDLQNAMRKFCKGSNKYPGAALIFVPEIPTNSDLPESSYKLAITSLSDFENADNYANTCDWSLDKWKRFAAHLGLLKTKSLAEACDQKLLDTNLLVKSYKKEFESYYRPDLAGFVEFPCQLNNQSVLSHEAISDLNIGRNTIIWGPSGCGKSLFAKSVGTDISAADGIPIYVEAKNFTGEFSKLLNQEIALLVDANVGDLFGAAQSQGLPVTIILDGYNECPNGQQKKLLRCLEAITRRQKANIIFVCQSIPQNVDVSSWDSIQIVEPSFDLKKEIAERTASTNTISSELLNLAKNGLEATIVGTVHSRLKPGASRFVLFDEFLRTWFTDDAATAISILASLSKLLNKKITFSISTRDFDRFMERLEYPRSTVTKLLECGQLIQSGMRISFGHELFFAAFSAEAIVRECDDDPKKVLSALSTPKYSKYYTLILGAIDDIQLLEAVLVEINDANLIASILRGECGLFSQEWAKGRMRECIDCIKKEAASVTFELSKDSLCGLAPVGGTFGQFSDQNRTFLAALNEYMWTGSVLDEVFQIVEIIHGNILHQIDELQANSSLSQRRVYEMLFRVALDDQNSPIAISKIIGLLDVGQFRHINNNEVDDCLTKKLSGEIISEAQWFVLLKLARFNRPQGLTADRMVQFIQARWDSSSTSLQFVFLDAARAFGIETGIEAEKRKIGEALSNIEPSNIMVSTFLVDALKSLGEINDEDHIECVRKEINDVLSAPSSNENWGQARMIYGRQFDHPYDSAYYEGIGELSQEKLRDFLCRAVSYKDEFRMFTSSLITKLASFGDVSTGKFIEHWAEVPSLEGSMQQDAMGTYFTAHVALAWLKYPLGSQGDTSEAMRDRCLVACASIAYWSNRNDLPHLERQERCQEHWDFLIQPASAAAFSALLAYDSVLKWDLEHMNDSPNRGKSLFEEFPGHSASICRNVLSDIDGAEGISRWFEREKLVGSAIQNLGVVGDQTDLKRLRELTEYVTYATQALASIQMIEERVSIN